MSIELDEIQKVNRSLREPPEDYPRVILIDGSNLGRVWAKELIEKFKEEKEPNVFASNKPFRESTYPKRYLERN